MKEIITVIISILSASGILGIGTRAILARLKRQETRQKAVELGVQALLRDRMLHSYNKYVNWLAVSSAAILAGVLSVLTSVAGLPEE